MNHLGNEFAEDGGNQDAEDRIDMVCIALNTLKGPCDGPSEAIACLQLLGSVGTEPCRGGLCRILFDQLSNILGQSYISKTCRVEGILHTNVQIQLAASIQKMLVKALYRDSALVYAFALGKF